MKLNFGIKGRLLANIVLIVIVSYFSFNFLFLRILERDQLLGDITENYQPSLTKLAGLYDKFEETGKLMLFWSLSPFDTEDVFSNEYNFLFTSVFPMLQTDLTKLSNQWVTEDQELLISTLELITDSLYFSYLDYISNIKEIPLENYDFVERSEFLLAETGIIFLKSEIEQNISFLMDSRDAELHSIYLCEFLWRQAIPFAKLGVPKLLEFITGANTRGGGEYLSVSSAWKAAGDSVGYFKDYYGASAYKAFKYRTTEDVGAFCEFSCWGRFY